MAGVPTTVKVQGTRIVSLSGSLEITVILEMYCPLFNPVELKVTLTVELPDGTVVPESGEREINPVAPMETFSSAQWSQQEPEKEG